jgi:valyl-tRNA synthetase
MNLPKTYNPHDVEERVYRSWEKSGSFTPQIDNRKKPFTIIMPPPNANDPLHIGHAMFVTVEDIMIRYHRMRGEPTLWLPGADHAGIETQVVYERKLNKEGKSRFDFDRDTFYKMLWDYSQKNKKIMEDQLRRLGASCDWKREKFTLDSDIITEVKKTFQKLYDDGLVYKGTKLVNWDPKQQTVLSELEVEHEERDDTLYYLDYGPVQIATVRPETIFADVAVAINPKDKRVKSLRGQNALIPIVNRVVPIVTDELVDPEFGTGALKITPGHDFTDAEIGERHTLAAHSVISFDGRMLRSDLVPERYWGMKVAEAKKAVVDDLKAAGKLIKEKPYRHPVAVAERSRATIEPLLSEQWFLTMKPLAKPAIDAVRKGKIKIVPKRFEKTYFHWMENIKDWPISRQIVWGIRLPVYYHKRTREMRIFVDPPQDKENWEQDPNTFDTWFSSGQWPFLTLGYPNGHDFRYFYPTSVMETGYDILFFWVARMIMLGLYRTGNVPFKVVYLNGLVRDEKGQKISKSKGNVIDPMHVIEQYGADALRLSLTIGVTPGNDLHLSPTRFVGNRNFLNKVWNASRFVIMNWGDYKPNGQLTTGNGQAKKNSQFSSINYQLTADDEADLKRLDQHIATVTRHIDNYRYGQAAEALFNFFWHTFADKVIEKNKGRIYKPKSAADKHAAQFVLATYLETQLRLLHPFIPFITEEIWGKLPGRRDSLIVSSWPET